MVVAFCCFGFRVDFRAFMVHAPERGETLRIVNRELFNHGEKNIPLKAFLGILNLHSGVMQIFNAGYIDPVIKTKNGNTSFIKGPFSPLLGTYSDSAFIPMSLQLNAGDSLYFYSHDTIELLSAVEKNMAENGCWR